MARYAAWSHRFGALGYSAFLFVLIFVEVPNYLALTSPDQRAAFAVQMQKVSEATTLLIAGSRGLETMDGYLQWFLFGYFPFFFPIWGLIAGTGAFRGEEDSGLLEAWLATGITRGRLVLSRLAGFTAALAVAVAVIDAVTLLAAAGGGSPLNTSGVLAQSVAEAILAPAIFMLGAFLAQIFPTRRNALGIGALILGALFFLNSAARQAPVLRPYRWISPWAYPDLSYAMSPHGQLSLGGTAVLVALTAILTLGVWWLMSCRDLGAGMVGGESARPTSVEAAGNPLFAHPALSAIWEQRVGLSMWSLGIGIYCLLNVPLTHRFIDFFHSQAGSGSPGAAEQARLAFGLGAADPVAGFVSAGWYRVACILLAAFSITQVARWSAEDSEGRLEMVLAAGRPRWRVTADRILTLTVALFLLATVNFLVVLPALRLGDLHLATGRVLLASVMVLPVALAFGAAGAAISAFRPRLAVWSLSAAVATGYLIPLMGGQIFRHAPPRWYLDLSLFQLYGAPLAEGVDWTGLWILLTITVAGFAISAWALSRREVGR